MPERCSPAKGTLRRAKARPCLLRSVPAKKVYCDGRLRREDNPARVPGPWALPGIRARVPPVGRPRRGRKYRGRKIVLDKYRPSHGRRKDAEKNTESKPESAEMAEGAEGSADAPNGRRVPRERKTARSGSRSGD